MGIAAPELLQGDGDDEFYDTMAFEAELHANGASVSTSRFADYPAGPSETRDFVPADSVLPGYAGATLLKSSGEVQRVDWRMGPHNYLG